MTTPALAQASPAHEEQAPSLPLEWRVHLAKRQPRRAAAVAAIILASAALCQLLFGNWLFSLFTAFALCAATAEFLLPIRYRLTPQGAEQWNLFAARRILWSGVKRAYLLEDGVQLSPLAIPTRLERYRGVFLRFADNRSEVLAAIRHCRYGLERRPDA
ncbi:MAG: hypothetical protein HY320_07930 [Armatimonadetes bacterium]|nr:hypothetical protein [Armatimonadota bacterium]